MSFNGSGIYTVPAGTAAVSGSTIESYKYNTFLDDLETALSSVMPRDGQAPATGNWPMGSHKLTGLAAGTSNGDSVRYEQSPDGIMTTRGDLLVRGASAAGRLAVGTSGQFLKSDGTDAAWSTVTGADIIDDGSGNLAQTTLITWADDTDFNITESMWGTMVLSTNKTANRTATLPLLSGTTEGFQVIIANASGDSYDLTIARSGSDAIYGPPGSTTSAIILRPNARVKLVKRNSAWRVVSNDPSLGTTYTPGIWEGATDAETQALSSSALVVTPSNIGSLTFVSAGVALSSALNTLTEKAHGFPSTPVRAWAYMECTSADLGYAVGDRCQIGGDENGDAFVSVDGTNVNLMMASSITIRKGDATTPATANSSKWTVYLCASLI